MLSVTMVFIFFMLPMVVSALCHTLIRRTWPAVLVSAVVSSSPVFAIGYYNSIVYPMADYDPPPMAPFCLVGTCVWVSVTSSLLFARYRRTMAGSPGGE